MFKLETVGPFLVRRLKWGGGAWPPWPPSGNAPDLYRLTKEESVFFKPRLHLFIYYLFLYYQLTK